MQIGHLKAVLAAGWLAVVCVAGIVGHVSSLSSWTVLLVAGCLPPIIMFWWWNDPPKTLSERIQEGRR